MNRLLFLVSFFIHSLSQAQVALIPRELTDDISMKIPLELKQEPSILQRTTSTTLDLFMSQDRRSDLSVNKSQLRWIEADEELLSQFYKANILNIYDQVDMIQEEIKEVNGKKFIVFEFVGQVIDEPNAFKEAKRRSDYTYIQYLVVDDGILIFRFTTSSRLKNYWQEAIQKAMESVVIEESKK
ncbi:MAG: hypothetical protein GY816_05315 [Cytophagales bacterium]|nr:hypothetical protein [Cytophagales bacterium]